MFPFGNNDHAQVNMIPYGNINEKNFLLFPFGNSILYLA